MKTVTIKYQQDEHGFWCLNELPENAEVATLSDFYNGRKELIINMPFLLQRFSDDKYVGMRVTDYTPSCQLLKQFIKQQRVFIFKK